jgi:Mg/Co/Ni transporter MgtE
LFASEMDFAFAFTIMIAQFVSIVTAEITGTFAPLLFSFVFKLDSGKWGGPLNTAFQDIVGTFAMVIVSYYLLAKFSAGNVDPNDFCGPVR